MFLLLLVFVAVCVAAIVAVAGVVAVGIVVVVVGIVAVVVLGVDCVGASDINTVVAVTVTLQSILTSIPSPPTSQLLKMDWKTCWNPQLFLENALGQPREINWKIPHRIEGQVWVEQKQIFRGTFAETLELWDFPFDVQVMHCGLEQTRIET